MALEEAEDKMRQLLSSRTVETRMGFHEGMGESEVVRFSDLMQILKAALDKPGGD